MIFTYKLATTATTNPVSNAEVQNALKTAFTSNDSEYTLIETLTVAAVNMVERMTGLQLMPATWQLMLSTWREYVELWHSPVTAITHVKYYDSANTLQTLSSTYYQTLLDANPAVIRFNDMPNLYDRMDAVVITFASGYSSAALVPSSLKAAIFMIVGHLYENRQNVSTMQTYEVPQGAEWLCSPYKMIKNPYDRAFSCT